MIEEGGIMETKVNIVGLSMDIIGLDYLILSCKGYLTNDVLNVIYLVSTKTLEIMAYNNEFIDIIESADFVLPANETLLSLHHVDALETKGMIVDYHFLYPMFESISEEEKTAFLVGRNKEEIDKFYTLFNKEYPNIKILGSCQEELLENQEQIVNEINGIAPDLLIFAVDTPFQEKWIKDNKARLNAKLCFAIGEVIEQIFKEHKEVPFLIKEFKLEGIYNYIIQNKGYRNIRDMRIFKKNVAHYNNKKGNKKNGENRK